MLYKLKMKETNSTKSNILTVTLCWDKILVQVKNK